MSTVKKRQHFVPKAAYLDNFCDEDGYLYAYDKEKLQLFRTKPDNVANKRFFYDFPTEEDKQKQTIENKLSLFENLQKKCIEFTINKIDFYTTNNNYYTEVIDTEQKKELAHIIGVQFTRTLEHREFISDFFKHKKHKLPQEAEEIHKQGLEIILQKTPSEYKSLVENFLLKNKEGTINRSIEYVEWLYTKGLPIIQGEDIFRRSRDIAELLMKHIWIIGVNIFSEKHFYTSDHPVAKTSPLFGIASKEVQISFPLNSDVILILFEREHFKHYEPLEDKIVLLTTEQIDRLNSMQIVSSYRQIYCRNNGLDLAEQMIKNSPYDLSLTKRRY